MAEPQLNFLLQDLVEKVDGTQCAVLLSVDGLAKSWAGLHKAADAERLAAAAGGMCSLASQFGKQLSGSAGMRQVVVELDERIVFITAASEGSVLVVATARDVDTRNVAYEMERLCKRVANHIATQVRAPATADGNGTR